jgi:hypothetical protein
MGSRLFAWLRALALVGVVLLMAATSAGALQGLGSSIASQASSTDYGAQFKRAFTVDVAIADNGDEDNDSADADNEDNSSDADNEDNSSDADNEDNSSDADNEDNSSDADNEDNSSDADNEDNGSSDDADNEDDSATDPDIIIDNVAADDLSDSL